MNIEKITQGKNLTDTEHTVLEYILDHLDTVQTEGVRGVARANYTSTSTIMRLARKMNYSGFVDMCYKLRSLVETPRQTMQEEEDFLNGFSTQSLLNYNTYTQLKVCAEKLLEQRDKMIFVYGTGFSGTVATYLTQKLVNMGILCFSATGGDSVGIFENTLERLLIPTGLHHLVYTPFLYTSLGGTATVGGQVLEGARNIYYAEIADPSVAVLSQSVIWDARGISKMFGLIGACLAMYQTARPENREKIKPVLITAAVTSFIAGVTEPIEFSFLFVAPILFVVHAVLAGSSFVVLNLLGCRAIGPNGFIDFLLYNLPLGIGKTRWPVYIAVGVLYFFLYYVIFRVLIVKMNLHTLGREAEGMEMKLHSKSEYKAKVAAENGTAAAPAADNTVDAAVIVEALGGKDNILKVTNCYTRLRTELADPDKVQDDVLKNQTGASAVIHKGKNVQVVYGLKVNAVRKAVDAELGLSGEE